MVFYTFFFFLDMHAYSLQSSLGCLLILTFTAQNSGHQLTPLILLCGYYRGHSRTALKNSDQ